MTESGYWQINTGDRSDGTISFTFWDFAKDYGIPPFTAALDKPYGAAARPVDGYVIIEWADSEIAGRGNMWLSAQPTHMPLAG